MQPDEFGIYEREKCMRIYLQIEYNLNKKKLFNRYFILTNIPGAFY